MSPYDTERRPNHNLIYTVDHTFSYRSGFLPVNALLPVNTRPPYIAVSGQEKMPLCINKMGFHWYFQFAVKRAHNRDKILKYRALKQL